MASLPPLSIASVEGDVREVSRLIAQGAKIEEREAEHGRTALHVAAAFGRPQVAIFGSSSPLHTPPLNAKAQVLWLKNDSEYDPPLDCAPCFERTCPLVHTRCLVDIQPARVLQLL